MDRAEFQITNLLRLRHNIVEDDDFFVSSQDTLLDLAETVTGALTLMLAAIAGISSAGGGYRHHEYHAGVGAGAHPGDWAAQGGRGFSAGYFGAVFNRVADFGRGRGLWWAAAWALAACFCWVPSPPSKPAFLAARSP
jgi:hypothetical protein